jgi:hypothetical protein
MAHGQGRPSLWHEDELAEARAVLDKAREQWRDARFHHALGSADELHVWTAYRRASDRVYELLQRQNRSFEST